MGTPNSEGQGRLIEEVIRPGLCVRCGACVALCPYFDYFDGKVVVMDPCPASTYRCLQVCPRADYEATRPDPKESSGDIGVYQSIFAARSTDAGVKDQSQYGGVVSALLINALEKGTLTSAVLTDAGGSLAPEGRVVQTGSEVLSCAGSRYSAAGGLGALNRAVKAGQKGLGVVGLPCQMQALARMRRMAPDGDARMSAVGMTIGLFCTWALEYRALQAYLVDRQVNGPVLKYDIPPPPAEEFKVLTDVGWQRFPLADIRQMVLKGCSLCDDMTAEHADISVGTVEGREEWNTVIARTQKGARFLERAVKDGCIETDDLPETQLAHLKEAARNKRERAEQAAHERRIATNRA